MLNPLLTSTAAARAQKLTRRRAGQWCAIASLPSPALTAFTPSRQKEKKKKSQWTSWRENPSNLTDCCFDTYYFSLPLGEVVDSLLLLLSFVFYFFFAEMALKSLIHSFRTHPAVCGQTNRCRPDDVRPCAYFLLSSQLFKTLQSPNRIYSYLQSGWIKHSIIHIYICIYK